MKFPLHRWLTWFDDHSSEGQIEEVIKMDQAILMAQTKLDVIARNPELLRAYEGYEKAASDWTSSINGARREGMKEGMREGMKEGMKEAARKLKAMGESAEKIAQATGLSLDTIEAL
jgi:predicted transposase/invertase (TIGR01784 family)